MGQMESKGGYLAEDVLIEILSRMSVKSLLQSSPAFISVHLQHNIENKDNVCLVVYYHNELRDMGDIVLFTDKTLTVPTNHDRNTDKWGPWMDPIHVAVYTLSIDSWKDFKGDAPDSLRFLIDYCFDSYLNGVYYWWSKSVHRKLVSFDMGKEEFKEFQGPPDLHQDSDCEILTLYNGSIALIYSLSRVPIDAWESAEQSSLALWVLMEEEEGCWIK
ncbi:unnamed protein product [Ilex paraguariensis]|uniref:F-box associated beta-propeller type 3 domain-containing protein n=1 Tax=Ilex paraguariensis TaxID=185542 RepID=A0ABC8R9L6_9AQUA